MSKLTYILLGLLILWALIMFILIDRMYEPETALETDYDYRIYHPIEVSNPDSLMMMLWCRGSKDSLWRMRNKL